MWHAGIRQGKLYTVAKRPLDPRWSTRDLHEALAWCATGQHIGFDAERAFQAAEALVMKGLNHGIVWPESRLTDDMCVLQSVSREQHEPKEHNEKQN